LTAFEATTSGDLTIYGSGNTVIMEGAITGTIEMHAAWAALYLELPCAERTYSCFVVLAQRPPTSAWFASVSLNESTPTPPSVSIVAPVEGATGVRFAGVPVGTTVLVVP
jgi:hypothetical protein